MTGGRERGERGIRASARTGVRIVARAVAALWVALALAGPAARAAEVAGVALADTIELDGVSLRLNGAGERTLYVVRTYVAALYVARPSAHASALLGQPGPRRLSLTMLAPLSSDWIVARLLEAIRANVGDDSFALLEPRLARLVEPFLALERLQKGDRIDLDAVGAATRLSVDGRLSAVDVPGTDVFDAVLRAFIGERPIDVALERALLGRPLLQDDPGT